MDESLTDEGLSAYSGDHTARGSLGRFYEAVREGRVERGTFLIVEHLDRLSRDAVRPALTQLLNLIDSGIKVVTLFDGHIYEENSKSVEMDLIGAVLHMSEAHKASASKSKRLVEAWAIKRAGTAPLTRMRPAWLSVCNDRNGIEFQPNEGASIIQRIFKDAASGLGSYVIAARLNAEGVPPLTGNKIHGEKFANGQANPKAGQPLSCGWNKSRIINIIKSDAPLGFFQPHRKVGKDRVPVGDPIPDYYPRIIDDALAERARAAVAGRTFSGVGAGRKGEVISNLFTHVIKCVCGASMFLSQRNEKRAGWLRCSRSVRDARACDNTTGIPYQKLEEAVIREFNLIKRVIRASPADDQTKQLEEILAKKRAEAGRLKLRIDELMESDIPGKLIAERLTTMSERHDTLSAEVERLNIQLTRMKAANRDVDDLEKRYILERMRAADPKIVRNARAELSMLIRRLFTKPIFCDHAGSVELMTMDCGEKGDIAALYDHHTDEFSVVLRNWDNGLVQARLMSLSEMRDFLKTAIPDADGRFDFPITDAATLDALSDHPSMPTHIRI